MAYLDQVYAVVQIAPTGIPTYVRLSQNENGRVLNFAVSGDALPAGSTVALTGTKPDGAVYSASGTLADNVATFNEDEQLTAVAGEWDAKVEVTNSGNLIATGRIKFVIDADPSGGNIPSDSQLDGYIAEMLSLLDAGKAEAYGSPLVASTVAGMIDQSRVYVYTGSETGYTAGNWYYWNGSAWTSGGVYNAVAVSTDTTLSIAGKAADAKATGDAIDELKDDLGEPVRFDVEQTATDEEKLQARTNIGAISEDAKEALVEMFRHVVYIDSTSEQLLNDLIEKLNIDTEPIPDISISNITYRYGLNTSYSGSDIPYCLAKNFRACYKDFDIDIDKGECYKIKWNKEIYPLSSAGICFYTQSARTKANNHNDLVLSTDYVETPWLENDSIIQVPKKLLGGDIVGSRFSFKANEDSSVSFNTDGLEPLTLTKVDIAPERTIRVLGLGELDKYNGVQNTYPYNSRDLGWGTPQSRTAYWKFDYPIVPGGRYYVEYDTSTCPDAQIAISTYNENTLAEVANHQVLSNENLSELNGGYNTSGTIFTIPTVVNNSTVKGVRITLRRNSSNTNFDESHLVKYVVLKYLGMGA